MIYCSEYDLSYRVHIIHLIPSTTKSSKKDQADDLDMAPEAEVKAPRVSHGLTRCSSGLTPLEL